MCYFHVKQAIEHKFHMIKDKSIQKDILDDIKDIQRSQSNIIFKTAIDLFNKKYNEKNNDDINCFLEYFHKEWVSKYPGWYEGFLGAYSASTNNGLESLNGKIKSFKTL